MTRKLFNKARGTDIISGGLAAALSTIALTENSIVCHKCAVHTALPLAELVLKSHY